MCVCVCFFFSISFLCARIHVCACARVSNHILFCSLSLRQLDYNYESSFFGVFGANHAERTASYYRPITDWIPAGQHKAQVQAKLAHVECANTALYFACHLAPWGLQSLDAMTRYMSWNGHFAALPFISHFEYTRNASFVLDNTLPLITGLNDWWACFLNKTVDSTAPDGYVYNDVNAFNPDYEHEGQQVPNPTIAMSFVKRTVSFQLELSRLLNISAPPKVADIASHLPAINTAKLDLALNFTIDNNTRCHDDSWTWTDVPNVHACEVLCQLQPGCMIFSYCPPIGQDGCTGTRGQPTPLHCWGYRTGSLCAPSVGWTSGHAAAHIEESVMVAYRGASVKDSDWFAMYPVWPSETMTESLPPSSSSASKRSVAGETASRGDSTSLHGRAGPLSSSDSKAAEDWHTAALSSRVYLDLVSGRGVDVFPMAVRTGIHASLPPSLRQASGEATDTVALTAGEVLAGLGAYMDKFFGPNLINYAPGGGIENTGMLQAVNEMLLYAIPNSPRPGCAPPLPLAEYTLVLFPFWPEDEPASFTTLLAKGGHVVSATWDNATRAVASPVIVTAQHVLSLPAKFKTQQAQAAPLSSMVSVLLPWPRAQTRVVCEGSLDPAPVFTEQIVTFATALNEPCSLVHGA